MSHRRAAPADMEHLRRCRRRWILLGVMRVLMAGIAANSSLSDTFRNLACALVLASAADLFFMHGGDVRSVIAAPFFGAVSLAGFLASLGDSIMPNDQILVRPQNTRTYMRIAAAATLFAAPSVLQPEAPPTPQPK